MKPLDGDVGLRFVVFPLVPTPAPVSFGVSAVGISPSGACPRTEPLVAAWAAYNGYNEFFTYIRVGCRGFRFVPSSAPRPPALPAVAGARPRSTWINLESIRIKINKENIKQTASIKQKSRENQVKFKINQAGSPQFQEISQNFTKS
jgi:hypothetical protein